MSTRLGGLFLLAAGSLGAFGQTLHTEAKFETPVELRGAITCKHGSEIVADGKDGAIYVWTEPGKPPRRIAIPDAQVHDVDCAQDGTLAVAVSRRAMALIDGASGEVRKRIDAGAPIMALSLSPDGSRLAVATSLNPTQLFNAKSGEKIASTTTSLGAAWTTAFSPTGEVFVSADEDTTLRGYDRSGKLLYAADGGLLEPFSLTFSADGKQFAAAGADGVIRIFDAASGKLLHTAPGSGYPIFGLQMSPDGQRVAALTVDDFTFAPVSMNVWDVRSGKVTAVAIDPKTCVGAGINQSQLLLIQQDSPKTLTVTSVQ